MIIEKLLRMQYNDTKRKYKQAQIEYRKQLAIEAEKAKQAEKEQKQRIDHLKKIIKEEEELARQEKRKKQLISELQIESATINHYESQLDYYRYRLLVQTTDKNKLKYSEHIFQIEQRIRKAKAKAEQIEGELSGF